MSESTRAHNAVERYGKSRNIRHGTFDDLGSLRLPRSVDLVVCAMCFSTSMTAAPSRAQGDSPNPGGVAYIEAFTTEDDMDGDTPVGTSGPPTNTANSFQARTFAVWPALLRRPRRYGLSHYVRALQWPFVRFLNPTDCRFRHRSCLHTGIRRRFRQEGSHAQASRGFCSRGSGHVRGPAVRATVKARSGRRHLPG